MEKATREIEKKYLKLDAPILKNVQLETLRFKKLSQDPGQSRLNKSKILKSTWMRKKPRKSPKTCQPIKLKATGGSASTALLCSKKPSAKTMKICWNTSKGSMSSTKKKALTTSPLSLPLPRTTWSRAPNYLPDLCWKKPKLWRPRPQR